MTNVTLVTEEAVVAAAKIHKNMTSQAIIRVHSKRVNLLPPDIRRNKVLDIHRQLAECKYEINNRLDVAIDRLLEGLNHQGNHETNRCSSTNTG